MAKGEIRQKIVLQGEKEYNAAVREAQRNLKTLQSEMKAETAELGKNATAKQKAKVQAEYLSKEIAEQQKIVETYTKALKEVTETYGENSDEMHRWEQRLNNARTTLANMQNGFQQSQEEANSTVVAMKAVADSLKDIGKVGDSVAGAIENVFSGMLDVVTGAVETIWDLISSTASKANQWNDIANYWGTDAQTIQMYSGAVEAAGKSFEDLNGIVSKLVLGGKGKKITELIGISDVNYKNDWDYMVAIMGRLYDMQQKGQDLTPIYEEIFGEKKSVKVMDIVNEWDRIQERLSTYNGNESGYGLTDHQLEVMDEYEKRIADIERKWTGLKDRIGGILGEATIGLTVNVEGVLDGIADFFKASSPEEQEKALAKIRTNIEGFFEKLGEIIQQCITILNQTGKNLQESDDPITRMIGDILVNLTNALQWMIDNQDKVKLAFETIFGFWLLGKLTAVAGSLAGIIAQIGIIKAWKGLELITGGAGSAVSLTPGVDPTTTVATGAAGAKAGAAAKKSTVGSFARQAAVNLLAAYGVHEVVKALPADTMTHAKGVLGQDTTTDQVIDAIRERAGIRTIGDIEQSLLETPLETSQKSMRAAADAILDPTSGTKVFGDFDMGKVLPSVGEKIVEKAGDALETVNGVIRGAANAIDDWVDGLLGEGNILTKPFSEWGGEKKEYVEFPDLPVYKDENGKEITFDPGIVADAVTEGVKKSVADAKAKELAPGIVAGDVSDAVKEIVRLQQEIPGLVAVLTDEEKKLVAERAAEAKKNELAPGEVAANVSDAVKEIVRLQQEIPNLVAVVTDEERALYEAKAAEEAAAEEMRHDRSLTEEQVRAIEGFWDFWRQNETASDEEWNAAFDAYEAAFSGQTDLFDKVEELMTQFQEQQADKYGSGWTGVENLPSSWWDVLMNWSGLKVGAGTPNQDGITRADIQGFAALPQNLQEAVLAGARAGVSGIRVSLDGYTVGQLVAPYVSEQIAKDLIM